ncbi:MAG: GNAT family N-acetyltransferase [Defluviitaleaceae bacterium]|nr:GNAT family N-acetyltransferase [Defluviitaleaceae bacterium]
MKKRIYRKLTISDLPLLMQLRDENPDFSVSEDNARQFLSNSKNWFFACIQENQIIGHSFGYEQENFTCSGNRLYIHGFGVSPKYRREGIGTGILSGIKEACKLLNIYKIFLITEKSNIAACGLYEKLGGTNHPSCTKDDARVYFFNPFE